MSKREKYILAIHFGFHDSNICIASSKKILLHLEAERIFREKKHMALSSKQAMENLIKTGLDYLSITIKDIETVYISRIENYFGEKNVNILGKIFNPIMTGHHNNHIGTSLPSNFKDALIICADGGSEDGTTKIYNKKNEKIDLLEDLSNTPMTGRFYGTLTQLVINSNFNLAYESLAGKTMGLAAYGSHSKEIAELVKKNANILNKLYLAGCGKLRKIFKLSDDYSKPWLDSRRCNLAFEGQNYWTRIFSKKIIDYSYVSKNLIMVGGCALNVVLNSKIAEKKCFEQIYVPPVSSDAGQSIGAILFNNPKIKCNYPFLGRGFGDIVNIPDNLIDDLLHHKIIAWYQGRSESGPRALGHRSFLGLPDSLKMKKKLSQNIKRREPFRPVAPIVAKEFLSKFFETEQESPFMTFSPKAKPITKKIAPAIVHIDGTSRIQSLKQKDNPVLHSVLLEIGKKTGAPILMNSSLNVMGEPIVDTPDDAFKNFYNCNADVLYINGERYTKR